MAALWLGAGCRAIFWFAHSGFRNPNGPLIKSAAAARNQLPLCLEPLKMRVLIRATTGSTPAKQSKMTPCRPGRQRLPWGGISPVLCRELGSGFLQSREARLQGAALELSLPVVRIDGLAVSRREAAGGGALSGVMNCLAAQVVA